ncbi:MAG TPA: LysR family transcriptional regulator, partial [Clostridiales bacterium]|nr:LysR family transcriptional regulator [Clostridiales bacterium]
MTLRHLKIFITVCDAGSMTAAAKKLYITQPSVSQAIAELEAHYHTRLFERLGRQLYITEAGKKLLSYARHILSLMEQAERELNDLSSSGTLRLGASMTIGTYLLSDMIKSFLSICPEVQILTTVDNTKVIEEMILSDQLDLALVEGPTHSADIVEET